MLREDLARRVRSARLLLTGAILVLGTSLTQAAECYWNTVSGNWSAIGCWGGGEPTSADNAYIINGGTAIITQMGEVCGSLGLGGNMNMPDYGAGTIDMDSGSLTIYNDLYLGYAWYPSFAFFNLSGTGQLSATNEYIGSDGQGKFTQTGGTNSVSGSLQFGYLLSGWGGTYTLKGGTLAVNQFNLGGSGNGRFEWFYKGLTATTLNLGSSGTLAMGFDFDAPSLASGNAYGVGTISGLSSGTLEITNGATATQSNGIVASIANLTIGTTTGGGTYNLSGAAQLSVGDQYVGYSGTGTFNQTGGTNSTSLYLGYNSGSNGTYNLSGAGQLSAGYQCVGYSGTGTFNQTGGTNSHTSYPTNLYLGYNSGSSGTYNLSSTAQLSAGGERVGYSGTGIFTQTGGNNTITGSLYLGYNSGSSGTYDLSGAGQLSAGNEYVGYHGTGTFTQTGGTNTAGYINIGAKGKYVLSGGTLNLSGGIENQGTLDLQNSSSTISLSSAILDMTDSHVLTSPGSTMTCNIDSHSLLIVPSGVSLNINGSGIVHVGGSPLDIASPSNICGVGSISDHVNCYGTLTATAGHSINLNSGVNIDNAGVANLGSGSVYVNDVTSGISSGALGAAYEQVASTGAATFTQTGGTISIAGSLNVGCNSGSSGTYNLSGTGQLSAASQFVGYSGSGYFTQTGGTNTITDTLYLGYNSGSTGIYNLNGGRLILKSISRHSVTGGFNFGGGTLQANGSFYSSLPMALTGNGGNANIDTAGYSVELSGVLSGTGGLNKLGSGTLTLSASNSFAGAVSFNGGLLQTWALIGLGNGTSLYFNGGGLQFGGTFDPSVRTMSFLAGGATLDTQTNSITLANPIGNSGSGGLTKLGSGKLTLSALNTYSGDTVVNGGTLEFDGGIAAAGTSLIDIQSGTAAFKTTAISKTSLNINTATSTLFEIIGGTHTVGAISGGGTTQLDAGAKLTATSISQGTIALAGGSTLTIAAIPGGPSGSAITPVPEPSACVLLASALAAAIFARRKKIKLSCRLGA
jgi:autotransporter-associated beta strand protein